LVTPLLVAYIPYVACRARKSDELFIKKVVWRFEHYQDSQGTCDNDHAF
jgi:hypothetical protein